MDSLRQWLVSLTAAAIFLGAAESLVSQGGVRRVLRLAGGLVLLVVLLRPITGLVDRLLHPEESQNHADLPQGAVTDDTEQNLYLLAAYRADEGGDARGSAAKKGGKS